MKRSQPGLIDLVREMAEQGDLASLVEDVLTRVDLVTDDELEGRAVIGTRAGTAAPQARSSRIPSRSAAGERGRRR